MASRGYQYLHFQVDAVQIQPARAVAVSLTGEVSTVRVRCQHFGSVYCRAASRLNLNFYVCHCFTR